MNPTVSRFAALMGSASFLTLTSVIAAQAQQVAQAQMAEAAEAVPEQVLVTGSLIHGTAAVGVPVTNLGVQDFTQTGNVTIGDLFRTVPQAQVAPGSAASASGGHNEHETRVNIRGLDGTGPRGLMMVDGVRFPPQADGLCALDPSIIPALALDRVDILADGASATYGSDAISGVINVVLKRGFDGATTLLHYEQPDAGGQEFQASQLWGRTWDGGDVTLTYEWTNQAPIYGNSHSKYTVNYAPWGLPNLNPITASIPGTISTGAPSVKTGTNCTNCWAIPHGAGSNFNPINNGLGPLTPGSASTLNWATFNTAANMGTNEIDPLQQGWEQSAQQRNSAVLTFDQRLTPSISFFATGFYSNRRVEEILPAYASNNANNTLVTLSVPTTNPYYPANAPAGLQVSYDLAHEMPPSIPAHETSGRYSFGLNLDLPFSWTGQIYDSRSYDDNQYELTGVNDNAVNVAVGNTVKGVTKPASVPYLNVFCDPTAFLCNSPQTLNYMTAQRNLGDTYSIEEKGARFDGPLFSLPAGQVKAAVGGTYESDNVLSWRGSALGQPPQTPLTDAYDSEPYTVWAGFAQIDIPVFGDNFNFPLVRKFDLEASWRHDQYQGTLSGGTSNPKLAFTWLIDEMVGASVRGSMGTSFRFANAGEYSVVASDANSAYNFTGQAPLAIPCSGNPLGGAAAALAAAGQCGAVSPGGLNWAGGPEVALRSYVDASTGQVTSRQGGTSLAPEKSINYSIGFEITPQIDFLRGLDVQATFYSIKINGVLQGGNNMNSAVLSDPLQRFHIILPSDLGCGAAANANPASCKPFEHMVSAELLDPNAAIGPSPSNITSVYWIGDGGTFGSGFLHEDGIDFNASYDWDMGNLGAWNTGITGTYYLHEFQQNITGGPVSDVFNYTLGAQQGVETQPRMVYRARLGWSDGPFNITGFLNYSSHFFSPWGSPAIANYSNIEPSMYTFDLSFGYNTGDMPVNDYLKNITLQLTVQNLMGIHPAFEYGPAISGRNAGGYNILYPDTGRIIGITVVKNW